jgi:hypothetical protein
MTTPAIIDPAIRNITRILKGPQSCSAPLAVNQFSLPSFSSNGNFELTAAALSEPDDEHGSTVQGLPLCGT